MPNQNQQINLNLADLENKFYWQQKINERQEILPLELINLLLEINNYDFFMLPETLRWNLNFIHKNKISECGGISKYLFYEGQKRGFHCRHQYGILMAKPYSTTHFWVEFEINGRWIAVDPLLIKLLTKVANLSPIDWPITSSPHSIFIALSEIEHRSEESITPVFTVISHKFQKTTSLLNPLAMIQNRELPFTLKTEVV